MTPFEPGEGWREVQSGQQPDAERIIWSAAGSNAIGRVWVRQKPVPALPTDDMTVLFAHWGEDSSAEILKTPDGWKFIELVSMSEEDAAHITGFEVLAEPLGEIEQVLELERITVRRKTAEAVLKRIRELSAETQTPYGYHLERVATEFGVES